ncbi:hypothetical protein IKF34_01015 [Candidatus Saccharibacteria bacterium]|nr:hypothetical protein [Candidatus Saccharibacteria bacterium]
MSYKGKSVRLLVIIVALLSLWGGIKVFADNAPYGMEYSGGELLSKSNVIENKELIDRLVPLTDSQKDSKIGFPGGEWLDGWISPSGDCRPAKYFKITGDMDNLNYSYEMKKGKYIMRVYFEEVVMKSTPPMGGKFTAVAIPTDKSKGSLFGGYAIYSDSECKNRLGGGPPWKSLYLETGENESNNIDRRLFVKIMVKLFDEKGNPIVLNDDLWFSLNDLDHEQSAMVVNESLEGKMYAWDISGLQPPNADNNYGNKFVADKSFVYAMGNFSRDENKDRANIFFRVSTKTQEEGLSVVFGFKRGSAVSVQFFVEQFDVTYRSSAPGAKIKIDGKDGESEKVIKGYSPSGATSTPMAAYWVANKDVILNNGKKVARGYSMTMEQIKAVKVNEDLEFTAFYDDSGPGENLHIFGSWGELSVVGNSRISGLASGATTGYTTAGFIKDPGGINKSGFCLRSVLSFANSNCNVDVTGMMAASGLTTDKNKLSEYIDIIAPGMDTKMGGGNILLDSGYSTTENGVYYWRSGNNDLTIGPSVLANGNTYVVRSEKNVTINGNLEYENSSYTNLNEIPKLFIYAGGDIKIVCGVNRIDAVLITKGDVDTCSDSSDTNAEKNSNRLKINGAIIANTAHLNRTYGAGTGNKSMIPAEIINYDTTLYMWLFGDISMGGGSGGAGVNLVKFTEVGREELPPRY